jgi:hypothetical protein
VLERRPRVFVSHRSHSDADQRWLAAFAHHAQAGDDGLAMAYDKATIDVGDRWRHVIDHMLAGCHAAVVLLTPSALESAWVLKETTILRWRYDNDTATPRFVLLPLIRSGLERQTIKQHPLWQPLSLLDLQAVEVDKPATAALTVKQRLQPVAAMLRPSPLDLLVETIMRSLENCGRVHLQEAIDVLNEPVGADDDPRRQLAHAIATAMHRRNPPVLGQVANALRRLEQSDSVRQILDVVSHMWVELEAAAGLLRASWQSDECRDLVLSCQHPADTLRDYVARAHAPWSPPLLLLLSDISGGAQVDDIAWQIRSELRRRTPHFKSRDDAWIDARLNGTSSRIFVGLGLPPPDVVQALQRRYPRLTFIFYVHSPQRVALGGVHWLEPVLDPALETRVVQDRFDAITTLAAKEVV